MRTAAEVAVIAVTIRMGRTRASRRYPLLPERKIQISTVNVVNQRGPERSWDWHLEATIRLGMPP